MSCDNAQTGRMTYAHARDGAAPTPDVCSCCGLPEYERESTFKRRNVPTAVRAAFCQCEHPFFWRHWIAERAS